MAWKWKSPSAGGLTIRRYMAVWVGSIVVCGVILASSWHIAKTKMHTMRGRILADAKALDVGRLLERTLLAERREDLLWRVTRNDRHRLQRDAELESANQIARGLSTHATSPQRQQIVADIEKKFHAFHAASIAEVSPDIETLHTPVDDALTSVRRYQDQGQSDMEKTIQEAWQLHASVDRCAICVGLFVGLVLTVGSLGLINRIVRPTLELTRAASRFGGGDFGARAHVMRNDELGALCRTFNSMADEVAGYEKTRLDFVAGVAHDLKNPLVTIGGAARILRKQSLGPAEASEWLDRIIQQVSHLENLTMDLLDTAQVATGRLSLNKAELDLTALLGNLRREQAALLSSHTLLFEGGEPCRVCGDKNRLERVALNLVSNAVKYSPEGSTILLKVMRRGSEAVFIVKDEGAGIPSEDLEIIFQPFGRGGQAQNMAKGTGMGLYIVKQIVEAHGGRIHVESQVGVGTTMEVALPLAQG